MLRTTDQIKDLLEQGVNNILSTDGNPFLLMPDGSVRNKQDQLELGPDELRSALYARFAALEKYSLVPLLLGAPAAADNDAVHAAITGSATAAVVVTTDITNPDIPRNLVVTPGGTTADVAAGDVTIEGTDYRDQPISEAFTFEADATGAVTGAKAFKTVTKIAIPIQDGAAATFIVGTGNELGLPIECDAAADIPMAILGTTITAHNPTVSTPATVAGTTIDMSAGTYNGSKVAIAFVKR